MLELGLTNEQDGWHGCLHSGQHVIWVDPQPHQTSPLAAEAANRHIVEVFRSIFALELPDFNPALEVLATIDPKWLESEALERETFGGKTMVENVLDIIRERISAAA